MLEFNRTYIEAFLLAAETANFSDAAKIMHYTPQAVSQYIRNLEASLNIQLFKRRNNRLELTPSGKHYYSLYRNFIACYAKICGEVASANTRRTSRFVIALSEKSNVDPILVSVIEKFTSRHPQIEVEILCHDTLRAIAQEQADVGILHSFGDLLDSEFQGEFLTMLSELLVVSPLVEAAVEAKQIDRKLWNTEYIACIAPATSYIEQQVLTINKLRHYGLRAASISYLPNVRSIATTMQITPCATIVTSSFSHLGLFEGCLTFPLSNTSPHQRLYCVRKRGSRNSLAEEFTELFLCEVKETGTGPVSP